MDMYTKLATAIADDIARNAMSLSDDEDALKYQLEFEVGDDIYTADVYYTEERQLVVATELAGRQEMVSDIIAQYVEVGALSRYDDDADADVKVDMDLKRLSKEVYNLIRVN